MKKICLCTTMFVALSLCISSTVTATLINQMYGGDRVVYDTLNDLYWYPILTKFTDKTRSEQESLIDSMVYAGSSDWQMASWWQTQKLKYSLAQMATVDVMPTEFAFFGEEDTTLHDRTLSSPYLAWEVNSSYFFTSTGVFDFGAIGMEGVYADVFNGRTADDAWGYRRTDWELPPVWAVGDADDHWVSLQFMDGGAETMVFNYDQHYLADHETVNHIGMGAVGAWVVTTEVASEPVPEPATMLLFGTGLAGLAGYRKRKAIKK